MNKKILMSIMTIGLVAMLAGTGLYAWFTDVETSTGNTFTAGTLNLDGTDMASFTFGTIGNMAPGDITGWANITVKSGGSLNAATFGRFTLAGDTGLSYALNIYDYKVLYFNADTTPAARWATNDPYYGTTINEDCFIAAGVDALWTAVGGSTNLNAWVNGDGALDIPGASWDMEGLKPNEYYVLSVRFQMDPAAGNNYQGTTVTVGYEVVATQINRDALLNLGLGGNMASAVDAHVAYLLSQVA